MNVTIFLVKELNAYIADIAMSVIKYDKNMTLNYCNEMSKYF